MTKTTKKSGSDRTKKSLAHRLLVYGGIGVVVIVIAYIIGYQVFEQYSLRKEAEGFANLKKDIIELQQDFNEIDAGWVYEEGCGGKGGVYNSSEAISCRISLTNPISLPHEDVISKLPNYISTINRNNFTVIRNDYSIPYKKNGGQILLKAADINSKRITNAKCEIKESPSRQQGSYILHLECNAPSSQFLYPRYDR